jgi:predicted PurR-regulated permease PerM
MSNETQVGPARAGAHLERQAVFWIAVAVALVLLIGLLREIMLPFIAGIVIAYFLNPLADGLERVGLPRVWASLLILLVAIVALVAVAIFVVPLLVQQAEQLATALPDEIAKRSAQIEAYARDRFGTRFPEIEASIRSALKGLAENWTAIAGWVASSLWTHGSAVVNFVSLLVVTPLVVFYVLVDWHKMIARIDSWLPRDHLFTLRALASDVNASVSAFIRGQGTVCLILGVFYAAGLSAAGLRYGLLVGLATGLLSFVPFVGWTLGLITASVLAIVQFWPDATPLAIVVGIFAAGQAFDAGFLSPQIVGSKIGLHPVWLIFALFVFSYLFGFVGVLVAVPVAAAFGVLVRFALDVYMRSKLYAGSSGPGAAETIAAGSSSESR